MTKANFMHGVWFLGFFTVIVLQSSSSTLLPVWAAGRLSNESLLGLSTFEDHHSEEGEEGSDDEEGRAQIEESIMKNAGIESLFSDKLNFLVFKLSQKIFGISSIS